MADLRADKDYKAGDEIGFTAGLDKAKVLEQAIRKAQANGWWQEYAVKHTSDLGWTVTLREKPQQTSGGLTANVTTLLSEYDILYDKDFAKALWGDEQIPLKPGQYVILGVGNMIAWRHHLKRMVVADDPIAYLAEHMPKD